MNSADLLERVRVKLWSTAVGPAIVIWFFGYVLVDIVAFLVNRSAPGMSLVASIPMLVLGVCQTEAIDMLRARMERFRWTVRASLLLLATLSATAVQALFDLYWTRYVALAFFPTWQTWALQITPQRISTAGVLNLWTFCLALTLLWAARASRSAEVNAARAAEAEAAAARAQSAALRLQLNPHFLFNTMNSISSLVALDRKSEAEEMMGRLCDFLRGSLNADPMADVPLCQEIDAIDAYLSIEATRFGERLEIDIDVAPDTVDAAVPSFILQPFVENAIKHGVSLVKGPAHVTVAAVREDRELVLTVTNSASFGDPAVPGHLPSRHSTGIGINNTRERLRNRYGVRGKLVAGPTNDGYRAAIRFPFTTCR
ncbi:MAG TPA: histidine kinase [Allosphingosinicella sp.]|uniref:sensor histidine kinase n=1 Tax=Allosphingosinicella sp. TaxID=2823234 RepID=UPI002F28D1F2